jgi:hypothetical protein
MTALFQLHDTPRPFPPRRRILSRALAVADICASGTAHDMQKRLGGRPFGGFLIS